MAQPSPIENSPLVSLINRWKETYELSFELADVTYTLLNSILDYCKTHNIPINEETGLWNLLVKSRSIYTQIEQINSSTIETRKLLADGFLQRKQTDKDFTEPTVERFLSLVALLTRNI
jgi:hypothetical protein